MNEMLKNIGELLERKRKNARLTLDDVALRSALARSTIQRIESGDASMSIATLLNYAKVLGVEQEIMAGMLKALRATFADDELKKARQEMQNIFK